MLRKIAENMKKTIQKLYLFITYLFRFKIYFRDEKTIKKSNISKLILNKILSFLAVIFFIFWIRVRIRIRMEALDLYGSRIRTCMTTNADPHHCITQSLIPYTFTCRSWTRQTSCSTCSHSTGTWRGWRWFGGSRTAPWWSSPRPPLPRLPGTIWTIPPCWARPLPSHSAGLELKYIISRLEDQQGCCWFVSNRIRIMVSFTTFILFTMS